MGQGGCNSEQNQRVNEYLQRQTARTGEYNSMLLKLLVIRQDRNGDRQKA